MKLETPGSEMVASALSDLRGCEVILGLLGLPELEFPNLSSNDLISKKPSFKNLDPADILILRKWLHYREHFQQLGEWAETLLRFLEINQYSLNKKALMQFQSPPAARMALLELSAFLLDFYFERKDLRFLNIVLKMMDMHGLIKIRSIPKDLVGNNGQVARALIQIRLLIMSEAAIQQLEKEQT